MTAMLRVRAEVRDHAARLAESAGMSMGDLVAEALDAYERERFWKHTQEALIRGDYDTEEERRERAIWESTLRDGLDDDG